MSPDEMRAEGNDSPEPSPQEEKILDTGAEEVEEYTPPEPEGGEVEEPEGNSALGEELSPPTEPSRMKRFLLTVLRWAVLVAILFGLGVLATWIVRVQPQGDRIDELANRLEAAEMTIEGLEEELSALTPLKSENAALQEQLAESQLRADLLRVLIDVTSAQVAMAKDDMVSAKASLSRTDARMKSIQKQLTDEDQDTLESMRTRLALVLDELDQDEFAAQNDLEVLTSNLLALERSLFGN
jgi:hypothetical protein